MQFSQISYCFVTHYQLVAQFNTSLKKVCTIFTALHTAGTAAPSNVSEHSDTIAELACILLTVLLCSITNTSLIAKLQTSEQV
jgi:hypothetical protein